MANELISRLDRLISLEEQQVKKVPFSILLVIIFIILLIVIIVHIFNMRAKYGYIFDFMGNVHDLIPSAPSPWKIALAMYYPWMEYFSAEPFVNKSTPYWIKALIIDKKVATPFPLFTASCPKTTNGRYDAATCVTSLTGPTDTFVNWTNPNNPLNVIPVTAPIILDFQKGQRFNLLTVMFSGFMALSENNRGWSVAQLYNYCFSSQPSKNTDIGCTTGQEINSYIQNIATWAGIGLMAGAAFPPAAVGEIAFGIIVGGLAGLGAGAGVSIFQQFTNQLCQK